MNKLPKDKLKVTSLRPPRGLTADLIKAPAPKPVILAREPTEEEAAYSLLVAKYPNLELLVSRLSLVSCTTGKPIPRVVVPDGYKFRKKDKLKEIAERLLRPETAYRREEVLQIIAEGTKVSIERAEIGLALMLEAGALDQSGELYYLSGSTPF